MTRAPGNLRLKRPTDPGFSPFVLPSRRVSAAYRRAREHLGRDLQPREREFCVWVLFALERGEVPGPTELNRRMGLKRGGFANRLSGNLAYLRRVFFEEAGLVLVDERYRWPQ